MERIHRVVRPIFVTWVLDSVSVLPKKLVGYIHQALVARETLNPGTGTKEPSGGPPRLQGEGPETARSDEVLMVRADVLGFRPEELELTVEPRLITIAGRRKDTEYGSSGEIIYLGRCPDLMIRILQLPVEIDPKRATAMLKGGILELSMPKALSRANAPSQVNAQWIA